ncbi:hypothetical protein OSB04_030389 [Centaurea solstitialis]|uniref:TATA box binding protein associated factor (TAF) histone-like fold domain-containing protein n=1 Tax=Centaurea solstitialis TaxID=347529 RepID=A0AA38SJR6_9ASTR|nr:hypothetical protein OSB04_030389 [Centaurea solstitialis]
MSIVPKETVEVISQSIGISNLSSDAALALAPDVEYRMREIMQEAIKCMHHSKRTTLTTDDVDSALSMRNVEPIYGLASGDPLRFKRALGHKDLFYIDDKDVDFKDVIEAPLPKAPLDTSVFCHWLAIEGVQPAIPENAPVEVIAALPETKKAEQKKDELPIDIRLPVKHVLSRELQLYFNKITELAVSMPDTPLFKEALTSLATDSGLHPLVPYFTCFIEDEVARGLNDFQLLFALMRLVWSLLQNPHIHVEPYSKSELLISPAPIDAACCNMCCSKKVRKSNCDNHWELRDFTANLVATICKRFGHNYSSLQKRLTKTLLKSFLDQKRTLTQHYGAIQGLAALGPDVVRSLLLPNLKTYLCFLEEMLIENQKKEMTRHEAWRVYGALLRAAGRSVYDLLKLFPVLPSPPANSVWRTNLKVIGTSDTNKRKANAADELEQQPSPKKIVTTDGPVISESNNKSETGEPEADTSDKHQMLDDGVKGRKDDKGNNGNINRRNASKTPAFLKQTIRSPVSCRIPNFRPSQATVTNGLQPKHDFDRKTELNAFDETKGGVKGLVDSGITNVPQIFIQPPELLPQITNTTDLDPPIIINLHGFNSDTLRRKEIVNEIGEASRTAGFFQVINHGIPVSTLREMKDGVLEFFNQDHDLKKKWYDTDLTKKFFYNSNVNLSSTLPVRWRDSFLCRITPDPPDLHELPPQFRDILMEYSNQVRELGFLLFKLISEALGLDSSYLKEIGCGDGLATICHYYPVSPQPELTIGAQKHSDNGFLTILLQDYIGGLQFLHRNQWVNVPYIVT